MSHLGGAAVSSITLGPKQLGAVREKVRVLLLSPAQCERGPRPDNRCGTGKADPNFVVSGCESWIHGLLAQSGVGRLPSEG